VTALEYIAKFCVLKCAAAYLKIKWSAWNPWAVARLNIVWNRYTGTEMYKARKEIDFMPPNGDYEDFAEQAFYEYNEAEMFIGNYTFKEKLKIIFCPFSCGDKYRLPWWRITNWILGVDEDEEI